jgi:hypothetical protein
MPFLFVPVMKSMCASHLKRPLRYAALALGLSILGGCAVYQPAPVVTADGAPLYPYAPALVGPPVVVGAPYYVGPPVSVDLWFGHGYYHGWRGYHHGYRGRYGGFHHGRR